MNYLFYRYSSDTSVLYNIQCLLHHMLSLLSILLVNKVLFKITQGGKKKVTKKVNQELLAPCHFTIYEKLNMKART